MVVFLRLLYGGAVVLYVYIVGVTASTIGLIIGLIGLTVEGRCNGNGGCTSDAMGAGKILPISSSGRSTLTIGSRCVFIVVLFVFFEFVAFFFLFFTNSFKYDNDFESSDRAGSCPDSVAIVLRWYTSSKSFCFLS
mgnify:CR=1